MKKKFKPIHLFTDELEIRRRKREVQENCDKANKALSIAKEILEPLIKRKLNDREIREIIERRSDVFIEIADTNNTLKNAIVGKMEANDLFNMLGISMDHVIKFNQTWGLLSLDGTSYVIAESNLIPNPEYYANIERSLTFSTQNDEQNEKYRLIKELSDNINECISKKYFRLYPGSSLVDGEKAPIKIDKYEEYDGASFNSAAISVIPNYRPILYP